METMVATAGKKASSAKNATPPDVYRSVLDYAL
jgi:hypothetical protein